jgi:hypothetical protein
VVVVPGGHDPTTELVAWAQNTLGLEGWQVVTTRGASYVMDEDMGERGQGQGGREGGREWREGGREGGREEHKGRKGTARAEPLMLPKGSLIATSPAARPPSLHAPSQCPPQPLHPSICPLATPARPDDVVVTRLKQLIVSHPSDTWLLVPHDPSSPAFTAWSAPLAELGVLLCGEPAGGRASSRAMLFRSAAAPEVPSVLEQMDADIKVGCNCRQQESRPSCLTHRH